MRPILYRSKKAKVEYVYIVVSIISWAKHSLINDYIHDSGTTLGLSKLYTAHTRKFVDIGTT